VTMPKVPDLDPPALHCPFDGSGLRYEALACDTCRTTWSADGTNGARACAEENCPWPGTVMSADGRVSCHHHDETEQKRRTDAYEACSEVLRGFGYEPAEVDQMLRGIPE
jgi:hypothetical protein